MLPTKFWFIWPSGFRGEDLKKLVNQKQELPTEPLVIFYSESTRPNDLLLCIGGAQQIFLILCQLTYGCNRQSCF
jgi:hypothetical protein